MPANIFTNLLILGRTPSAITSSVVLPFHLLACAFLELVPGALTFFSGTFMLAFIDSMGVLDNVTTGFNFLEEAFALTQSPIAAIAAANSDTAAALALLTAVLSRMLLSDRLGGLLDPDRLLLRLEALITLSSALAAPAVV